MAKYDYWITEEGVLLIEGWARDGLTDEQISKNIGVAYSTFREWVKKYSVISAALKKGKEVVDRQVENALLKRALGFHYQEEVATASGVEMVTRYEKPDVTAAIFWLKNRKGDSWRNKEKVDIKKVQAETELIKKRTELMAGLNKDTGLLEVILDAVGGKK